jgi:hypothetical protein
MNIGIFIHDNIYKLLNIRHDCLTATEKGNCDVIYLIMFILCFTFTTKTALNIYPYMPKSTIFIIENLPLCCDVLNFTFE